MDYSFFSPFFFFILNNRRVIDTAFTMERRHYGKGSLLIEQGYEPEEMMFIMEGKKRTKRKEIR